MKIGLYGGLANNCYRFAKMLAQFNNDIIFIRDRNDKYAFSQPLWYDKSFVTDFESVAKSSQYLWKDWVAVEVENNWQPPEWLRDPLLASEFAKPMVSKLGILTPICYGYLKQWEHRSGVVSLMQNCDVLFVCGIEASILAMMSGKPYIIWPHGADIRMAAGLLAPPKSLRDRSRFSIQKLLLLSSFYRAELIGTHDPKGLGGMAGSVARAIRKTRLVHIPIPIHCTARDNKKARRRKLVNLMKKLEVPLTDFDFVGLVPSRIDFDIKGHDYLLNALKEISSKKRLHLIFSGWGNDYLKASDFVKRHGIQDQITFLPFALSQPLLTQFMSSVDFVIDQFKFMGTYGTAAVEALAIGCPTMMWIDEKSFKNMGWEAPPVINAKTQLEIKLKLESILDGSINLESVSQQSQSWVKRVHSPNIVLPTLTDLLHGIKISKGKSH